MTSSAGDNPGVHLPPPLFYLAAIGGGAVLRRYLPLTIGWDAPRMIAAWTFIALFAALTAWSFTWFARQKTTIIPNKPANALVLDGPFRFTRNPLYLAMALLTIGAGLWLNTWWVLFASISYGTLNIGRKVTAMMAVAGFVEWILVGTVIGAVYRVARAPRAG